MKKINKILFSFFVIIFLMFTSHKAKADTPQGVYITLEASATEVMPGEDIYVKFSIFNTNSLPSGEKADILMLYFCYDSSKFSIEFAGEQTSQGRLVSDNAKLLGPTWSQTFRWLDELIVKTKNDNINVLLIDIMYNYSTRDFITDGEMFSLKFTANENASGSAEFYLDTWDAAGYGYVETYPGKKNVKIDNTYARTNVKITGEPENEYTISFNSNGGTSVESITAVYGEPITEPTPPTRTGYIFKGWYYNGSPYTFTTMPNQNIELVAMWDPIEYTIKFDSNGGIGSMQAQKVTYDTTVKLTKNTFTKEGYQFKGWATTPSGNVVYQDEVSIKNLSNTQGEITLYAVWEKIPYTLFINSPYLNVTRGGSKLTNGTKIYFGDVLNITYTRVGYKSAKIKANNFTLTSNTYTVGASDLILDVFDEELITYTITYNLNGGINNPKNPDSFTVESGIITLLSPTKEGYKFLGWYTDSSYKTKIEYINASTVKDYTLYARWQAVYQITLDANGGEIEGNPTYEFTVDEGNPYGVLLLPTRKGYTFVGWYTDITGGTKVEAKDYPNSSLTLYARWQVKINVITFNTNGGSSIANIVKEYNTIIYEPTRPTKIGYTFVGWYQDSNLTIKQEFPFTMPDYDITLYAKWEINQYTITFDSNGGSFVDSIVANYNATITKPNDPVKTGYRFAGWYTDNNTFTNPYTFSKMPANDVVLYAKWIKIYEISFDSQGGTTFEPIEVLENSKIGTLPTPKKVGFTFLGWFTEPNGLGTNVTANTIYNFKDNLTLYAYYEPVYYSIVFNTNGGSPINTITGIYNEDITWPSDPIKIGYYFQGWYTDAACTKIFLPIAKMPSENLILYAKWEIKSDIKITFETNGGEKLAPLENLTYKDILNLPTPIRNGYKFVGWYLDESLTISFTSSTVPAEDTHLYAKWIATYTINFVTNSSDYFSSIVRYENETYDILPTPSKIGYKFVGWYTTEDFLENSKVNSNDIVTSSITLYAKFELLTFTITFITNGGSAITPNPVEYAYGEEIFEPKSPKKAGFVFAGWYTDEGLTKQFIFTTMPAKDLVLYAKWEAEDAFQYTIHLYNYDNNNGKITIYRFGSNTFNFPEQTIPGYRLVGWYKDPSFSEDSLVKTTDIVSGSDTEINLYAKWEIIDVTLTLIVDGVVYEKITQKYNTKLTTPSTPTKDGYTFVGWFKSNDGGKTFSEEFIFENMPSTDLTIYAKFTINNYTLNFETNGGYPLPSITKPYNTSIILPTPTKEGYQFLGWYDALDNLVTSPYVITNDATFYAKWEEIGYNDTTIDKIIVLDKNNNVIKTISSVNEKVLIYIPNQYDFVTLNIIPLYSQTLLNYSNEHTLTVGIEETVNVLAIAKSGKTQNYEVVLIRDTNPILTNITLNNNIEFFFDGSFTYNVTVPINVASVEVKFESISTKNKIQINGQVVTLVGNEGSRVISLNAANENTIIKITVTSLSGEVTNEYVITIYRSNKSNDASITSLEVYGNNSLKNELYQKETNVLGFVKDIKNYYINVDYKDTFLIINPIYAIGAKGIISGNDNLKVGLNIITIEVIASDGITKNVYTIEVYRANPSSAAELDRIQLKNLDTNELTDYEVSHGIVNIINVPYSVKNIYLIPIKASNSSNAIVTDLGMLTLVEGNNDFIISITAEDGITVNEYQIRINRAFGNTDNTLSYLSIGGFSLTPNLDLEKIFNYSLQTKIPYTTNTLQIIAEKKSPNFGYVIIKYDSLSAVKDTSLIISPVIGTSTIEIIVYPEKGEAKTYTITIEKENFVGNSELSSLVIKDNNDKVYPLNPTFNMQVLNYDLGTVEYGINSLKILASSVINSKIASVTFNGSLAILNNNEYIGELKVGLNEIIITVASTLDASQTKEYKITVVRENGEDINTCTIQTSVGILSQTSNNTYSLLIPKSINSFILDVIKTSSKSKVYIDGIETTRKYIDITGKLTASYTIEVVSEIGNKNIYTVNVNRSNLSDNANLSSLIITGGNSKEVFNLTDFKDNVIKTLTVSYMDDFILLNPLFEETGATISMTSASLKVGLNEIIFRVTAPDGFTTKDYVLKINRQAPSNIALLENILIFDFYNEYIQYNLNEVFNIDNFYYSCIVNYTVSKVRIKPITYPNYSITWKITTKDGVEVSEYLDLNVGLNEFIIEVISESKDYKNYYNLTITRETGDGTTALEYLRLTDQVIDYREDVYIYPAFGYFEYGFDKEVIFLSAKTIKNTSRITLQINSEIYDLGNEINYRIDLKTNILKVSIIVTAENGTQAIYQLNIRKQTTTNEIDIYDLIISGLDKNKNEVEDFSLLDANGNIVSFDKNINSYYVVIPYKYKQIIIKPQVINSKYSPKDLLVNVVANEVIRVDIKVDSPDESAYINYSIYIKGESGDNRTTLDYLEVLDSNNNNYLAKFNPNIYQYEITIPKSLSLVKINPTPTSSKATVIIGDKNMRPYPNNEIPIDDSVEVYVWITAEDGSLRPYVLIINKSSKSDNPYLKSITIKDNFGNDLTGDLIPEFNPKILNYQIVVNYNVTFLTITGEGVDGAKIISNTTITNLDVLPFSNHFVIVSEAMDGTTVTYTFIIFRLLPLQDTSLTKITLGDNEIEVVDGVYVYSYDVNYANANLPLKLIPSTRISKIFVNGIEYYDDITFDLEIGLNEIVIEVVAEDGVTTRNYYLNITRRNPDSQAYIEDLEIINTENVKFLERSADGKFIEGKFDSNKLIQFIEVDCYQEKLVLKPLLSKNSKLKDYPDLEIETTLEIGYNVIPIRVVAEDGVTENNYIFIVKRDAYSSNTNIKNITVKHDNVEVKKISSNIYKVTTVIDYKNLEFNIELEDEKASCEIITSEEISGKRVITLRVTAEDGVTTGTYYIFINQGISTFSLSFVTFIFSFLIPIIATTITIIMEKKRHLLIK